MTLSIADLTRLQHIGEQAHRLTAYNFSNYMYATFEVPELVRCRELLRKEFGVGDGRGSWDEWHSLLREVFPRAADD
jgi:hypothetical protein